MASEVGIDWLQMTTPGMTNASVVEACYRAVEGEAPKVSSGRRKPGGGAYQAGHYWPTGIEFHTGAKDERSWLIVQGSACAAMGFQRLHALARTAMLGASVTRLDVRRDERGEDVRLVRDVEASCEALELRRLRQFTLYPIRSADGGVLGRGVLLGSYASPKFVRCYDKGLETGTLPEGKWARFEAQFRGEIAHNAACQIFTPDALDQSRRVAVEVLHGVVDFRVGPRGDGVHVGDLPRPGWWESFLAGIDGLRLAESVLPADLDRWRHAFQHQYGNVMAEAARRAGVSLGAMMEVLLRDAEPTAGTRDNPMVGLIAASLGGTL